MEKSGPLNADGSSVAGRRLSCSVRLRLEREMIYSPEIWKTWVLAKVPLETHLNGMIGLTLASKEMFNELHNITAMVDLVTQQK